MLDGNHISCFNRPVAENDGSVQNGFDRFVLFGNDVYSVMPFGRIEFVGDDPFQRGKKKQVPKRVSFFESDSLFSIL